MKKLILLSVLTISFCLSAMAQEINLPGDYVLGAAPTTYTALKSVTNATTDSVHTQVNPFRNSVGFQTNVVIVSGTPTGAYIQLWGSKMANPGYGTNNYYLIATDTIRTGTYQVFNHDINLGRGNPWQHYKHVLHGVGSSVVTWQNFMLIR